MNIREAYDRGRSLLSQAGVPEADLDAWYLLEYVTGIGRASFYAEPDREMTGDWAGRYEEAIARRSRRIPLQHITGEQEFMGLSFQVNGDVLIPRQDTEILVEEALKILKEMQKEQVVSGQEEPKEPGREDGIRILDLCTGSGCILLSVLYYGALRQGASERKGVRGTDRAPGAEGRKLTGVGADISEKALAVARKNAEALGIEAEFVCGDLFENLSGKFSLILSNPPYIKSEEIEKLQDEVRLHDPRAALDGMEDGLHFYRRIIESAGDYLVPGGWLVFEIGHDQAEDVTALMRQAGYGQIRVKKDLAGLDRVVCGVYSEMERPEAG